MNKTSYNKEEKLWKGRDIPPFYNPKISLAQVILESCHKYGSKIAQINDDSGIQLSFDEMRIKTIRAAQNLQKLGYGSNGISSVIARNSNHLAPIVFASIAIGNPVNVIDTSFGKTEFLHMLKTTEPILLFCDIDVYGLVKECLNELDNNAKIFTFGGRVNGSEDVETLFEETHDETNFVPVEVDGENESAIIVCSSGTTGLCKGVCLSHAALLDRIERRHTMNSTDIVLCFISLYGIAGWSTLLLGTIHGATRVITTKSFAVDLQLSLIEKYKATYVHNAPFQLALLLKSDRMDHTDLSSIKFQVSGGATIPLYLKNGMISKLKNGIFYTAYGMTELPAAASASVGNSESVGQLLSSCTAKVIDEKGNRCGVGEHGEICFKLNYRFLGYYGNQAATDAAFDEEGFILTGDIGYFDENADLFIVDRKKDLIRCNNYQVSPSEIESFLIESLGIKVVCVAGIRDETSNELPAAFIVRNPGSNITEKEVFDTVAGHFADHCKLRGGVYFMESFPSTPSGKVLRRNLIEYAIELKNKLQ